MGTYLPGSCPSLVTPLSFQDMGTNHSFPARVPSSLLSSAANLYSQSGLSSHLRMFLSNLQGSSGPSSSIGTGESICRAASCAAPQKISGLLTMSSAHWQVVRTWGGPHILEATLEAWKFPTTEFWTEQADVRSWGAEIFDALGSLSGHC